MADIKIPLLKYIRKYFPQTSLGTGNYWAKAGLSGRGPLAGKIEKILGRWYVIESQDMDIARILKDIDKRLRHG